MPDKSLEQWLVLALTPRIGPITALKLIREFNGIDNIFKQSQSILEKFLNKTTAKLLVEKSTLSVVEKIFKWHSENKNRAIISLDSEIYPQELKQISDPPLVLYMEGNIELLRNDKMAIVGTRYPTKQGVENAFKFAADLAKNHLTIVSGMALGIDRSAHLGAINTPFSTIGVIGTGIDVRYPKYNNDLYDEMIDKGLLISEYTLGIQPLPQNFPRRNRIVTGLAKGCLVIESTVDGGSLISANLAAEMGREVMAIPGSIYNPVALGCHKLIKNGAKLVENINDVLEEISLNRINIINHNDDPILESLGFEPIHIDEICKNLDLEFSDICAKLLDFELNGLITNCGNGYYQRIFK